jgi:uncharacterized protein with PIN domain
MSFLCNVFGHKPPSDYSRHSGTAGNAYLKTNHPVRDNVGRVHLHVYGSCPRCGQEYWVGIMHLHDPMKHRHLDPES